METEAPSKYITLVASDGFEFVVLREAAMVSPVIKAMLNPRSECFPVFGWAHLCRAGLDGERSLHARTQANLPRPRMPVVSSTRLGASC